MRNFKENLIRGVEGQIFFYTSGTGPPVLLIHGYPQSSIMWEETASILRKNFTTIIPDLRGYGRSFAPKSLGDHSTYSKRAMATDLVNIMDFLSFKHFAVIGHDRGGRVAHRLARDYPERVTALSVLDICPTLDMYELTKKKFATSYFHWFFLTQDFPIPEIFIEKNCKFWMETCLKKWSGGHNFGHKFERYYRDFNRKKYIHSSCEDYRASASIDLEHDKLDRLKKLKIPIQVLWGCKGVINECFDPIKLWSNYTQVSVSGEALPCYHFIPEELPELLCKKLREFL